MEEALTSRALHLPRQVVNASKDGGGAFSKVCILSESFVLVRNNELLYAPASESKCTLESPQTLVVDPKPVVIQSFVLDVETCALLSHRNVFFALTCEFSLLIGAKVGPEAFTFNEIVESFYSESEVDQTLLDSPTSMYVTSNPSLIVVGTLRRIVIVSVDIDAILNEIEELELRSIAQANSSFSDQDKQLVMEVEINGDFVLGEKLFEIRLDDYIFLEEVRTNYQTVDDDISAIYSPQVREVSVWSHDESSFTVVAVGDGNWIRFMPLEKNEDDDIWEDAELVDKVDASQPSPFVWMTDHEAWITAISKAATCATIYATGDHVGTLIIWRPRSTSQKDSMVVYEKDFSITSASGISGASIQSITQAPVKSVVDGLFIGDSSGNVVCVKVDYKNRIIENVWKMRLFTPESYPTVARWNSFEDRDAGGTEKQEDVLIHSHVLGVAYKCRIHNQIAVIFNAAHGNDDVRQHKSFIEVCAVLVELDALVTAGSENSASIWRLSNGEHILTIPLPEYFVTSVAAYDVGYVVGGVARILFGFASGTTINYLVRIESDNQVKIASLDGGGNEVAVLPGSLIIGTGNDDASSLAPDNNGGGLASKGSLADDVTSVDILDEITGEEVVGGGRDADGVGGEYVNSNSASANMKIKQEEQHGLVDDAYRLSIEVQNSTSYCPMPVTDIFISSLGLYFAFVFGKQQIVVHEWESHRALHQIQLDDSLVDVSIVTHRGLQDLDSDVLVLALQAANGVKLLDALSGSIIEEHSLRFLDSEHEHAPPKVSRLWYYTPEADTSSVSLLKNIDIFGVCAGHDGTRFFAFKKNQALMPLPNLSGDFSTLRTRQGKLTSQLEYLVLGGQGISDYVSPLASIWTTRHGILMRSHEGRITRVIDYNIIDDKARVVHTSALKILNRIRANRALVVLSDGTVFVLHV
jgi:hypothetical protein